MPRKSSKNSNVKSVARTRTFYGRTAKNRNATPPVSPPPPNPVVTEVKVSPEIAEKIAKIDTVVIAENPKLLATGTPPIIEKVETPKQIVEQIKTGKKYVKSSEIYEYLGSELPEDFVDEKVVLSPKAEKFIKNYESKHRPYLN